MSDRDYLDHFGRVIADNVTATIEEANSDGSYLVRTIGSRAVRRASPSIPGATFKKGQRVIISEPSASRNVLGAEAVIQGGAPKDQRGLAGTSPAESRTFHERPVIYSVDPDPLVLEAGGASGEQTIIGRGLTEAAVYVRRSALSLAPVVANDDAPFIEPERVIMSIAADADSPLGFFSLNLGSAVARDALRIIPPATGPTPPYLVVIGNYDVSAKQVVWILDPTTLAVLATLETPSGPNAHVYGFTAAEGLIFSTNSGGSSASTRLYSFDPASGIVNDMALSVGGTITLDVDGQLVFLDGRLFQPSRNVSNRGLLGFETDASGLTVEWNDPSSSGRAGVGYDDNAIYLAGSAGIIRLNRSTFAQEATISGGNHRVLPIRAWTGSAFGAYTGLICCAGRAVNPARWRDSVTLAQTVAVTTGQTHTGPVQVRDKVYLLGGDAVLYECALDGSTVTAKGTLSLPNTDMEGFCSDGTDIYHVRTDDTVRKVDTDGVTIATSAALVSPDPLFPGVDLKRVMYVA